MPASVGNRSNTNTVGSLPLSLGEFWWGQRSSGGVGGAKVGRRSAAYRVGTASSARVPRSLPLVAVAAAAAALHGSAGARSLREIVSFLLSLLKQSSHDVGGAHRSTLAPNFTLLPPPGGEAKRATGTPGFFSFTPPSALGPLRSTKLTGCYLRSLRSFPLFSLFNRHGLTAANRDIRYPRWIVRCRRMGRYRFTLSIL